MRRKFRLATILLLSFLFLASVITESAMAHGFPIIISVDRSIETPNYDQSITITAQVKTDGTDMKAVILRYQIDDDKWVGVTMSLDGWDENYEDGTVSFWDFWNNWHSDDEYFYANYTGEISAQPYNTRIIYQVYAYYINGHCSYSDYYSYTVSDFVPPEISNIQQAPSSPLTHEPVTISATVSEPPEASGVKNVTLCYSTNEEWLSLDMNMQNGVWSTIIPGQKGGVTVKFFAKAFDKKGNSAETSIFDYIIIKPNDPPVANFTESAETVDVGEVIFFDASESYDPDGTIVSYSWSFGDGTTATGINVSHAYDDNGTYTVSLMVTDDDGATDSASAVKTSSKSRARGFIHRVR